MLTLDWQVSTPSLAVDCRLLIQGGANFCVTLGESWGMKSNKLKLTTRLQTFKASMCDITRMSLIWMWMSRMIVPRMCDTPIDNTILDAWRPNIVIFVTDMMCWKVKSFFYILAISFYSCFKDVWYWDFSDSYKVDPGAEVAKEISIVVSVRRRQNIAIHFAK